MVMKKEKTSFEQYTKKELLEVIKEANTNIEELVDNIILYITSNDPTDDEPINMTIEQIKERLLDDYKVKPNGKDIS